MRTNARLGIVGVALLHFFAAISFGFERPGWYEGKGTNIPYGQTPGGIARSGSKVALALDEGGASLLSAPDGQSPEVQELARNLQYDPKLMFEFVRNKIDYVPYYGFLKGATQTLLDRSGNDADQAALLAALLRAGGFTATYNYGYQYIPTMIGDELTVARWFDLADNATAVDRTLAYNGIPGIAYTDWTIMDRIWVEATITGQVYQLDAAFKPHTRPSAVNLASAMGYNRSAFLTSAGGEVGTNYARNLNEPNLALALCALSSNLVATFRTGYANSELDDILGKSAIIPFYEDGLPAMLTFYTVVTTNWAEPPDELIHTVRIQHGTIDQKFAMSEIAGKRLAIVYTNDMTGSGPLAMRSSSPETRKLELASKDLVPPALLETLPNIAQSDASSRPFAITMPDNLVSGQVVEVSVPATAAEKDDSESEELLSYPFDFGLVYTFAPYNCTTGTLATYTNPNAPTLHVHSWIENNGSGAYSAVSGIGTFDLAQNQSATIKIRFNGSGQSYGTKTATVRVQAWYTTPLVLDDTFNLTGRVVEYPSISSQNFAESTYMDQVVDANTWIRNNGSKALTINGWWIAGTNEDEFGLYSGFSGILNPNNYANYGVMYYASLHGASTAYIRLNFIFDGVQYSDCDLISLLGVAYYQPDLTGSYGCDYGTYYYQEPLDGVCRFKNSSACSLTINSVTLTGGDAARFQITSGSESGSVSAGSWRNIGVRYKADMRGSYAAAAHVVYNCDGIGYSCDLPLIGTTVSRPLAQLWLDDTLVASESTVISGAVQNLIVTLDHPYSAFENSYLDQTVGFHLKRGAAYALVSDFGGCGAGRLLDSRQRMLEQYRRNGHADSSREVMTETLNVLGQTWMRETVLSEALMNRIDGVNRTYHHRFGVMAQEEGYYVDVKAQVTATIARDGDVAKESAHFRASGLMSSALEHGILEQMQGTNKPSVSTVRLLQLANQTGQKFFYATSNNYASISTQLLNYTSMDLASFSARVNAGQILVLPENAQISLLEWQGKGYIVSGDNADGYSEIAMIIEGDYYGGYSAYQDILNSAYLGWVNEANQYQRVENQLYTVNDPVDIATGNLAYDREDLSLGSGVPPLGLSLKRFYNSGQINLRSPLGYGWHHNLDIQALVRSEGAAGLGRRSPADAAALLVASVVIGDVVANENNAKGWAAATLASKWATDQLNENAVSIEIGDKNLEFIRLPDGSYNPPPGATAMLTKPNGLFRLEERFGVVLNFNADGRPATWKDADDNTLNFGYNAQTNLQTVSDCFGRTLTFAYDGTGSNLVSVSDNTGRSVAYSVSGGNLTNVVDAEGFKWALGYDSNHRLLWMADPLGQRTVSNLYSSVSGKVLSQVNGAGQLWNLYVVPEYRGAEQNPLGDATVHLFDDKGRQTSLTDALGNTRYAFYDGQNHLSFELDPLWNFTQYEYDNRQNRTNAINALDQSVAFAYDSQDRLVKVTDALGQETVTEYDAEHHPTLRRNALGNQTTVAYYANGLPQTVTGPRGETTSYTYDGYGNPATVARTDGGTETRTWNARGDLLTLTDANTNTTTFAYDQRRLPISARDPLGYTVSNVYNAAGLLVTNLDKRGFATAKTWSPTYKEQSVRYPDGGVVSNVYDAADRLCAVRDQLGFVVSNEFDKAGRAIRVINARGFATTNSFDANGNLLAVRDPAGNVTANQYDALNRVIATSDALGHSVSNEFDEAGRLVARTDQAGKRTEFEHDALGRVTLERHRDLEFHFEYDATGNRTAFVNAKNARTGFGFDKMNRLVAQTNALGQVEQFVYDPVGNLRQKINANGQATWFFYNAANQLTNRQSAVETASFFLDRNGNLTNMVDALGVTRQTFDAMNRLLATTDPFGQTVSNIYNLAGWRAQLVYPDGKVEQFAYNGNGRLTNAVAADFGLAPATYAYDSRDNLTGSTLPGGLNAAYAWDALNRLSSWSISKAGNNLLQRSCTRNALGFKTAETVQAGLETLAGPGTQTRQHNAGDQIMSVAQTGPSATNLPSFDPAGNTTQLVVSVKGQTFTTQYRFDYQNRLLATIRLRNGTQGESVTTSVTQLEYDGLGLLSRITDNGTVRRLVRDRVDQLARPLVETDVSGNPIRRFVWANGRLLAQVGTNSVIRVALSDEMGRTLAFADNNGALTDEFAYQPYGRLIAHSGTTDTPFTWLGAYGVWNAGHGLLYLTRHRAYDSNLMRFVQADPIGLQGGANLYGYAGGNPLFLVDPSGLTFQEGLGNGMWGFVKGAAIGGAVVLFAPEAVVVGLAVGGAALAGFGTGQRIYEVSTGSAWTPPGNGQQLSQDERYTRAGELVVDVAGLGTMGTKWFRNGSENDFGWAQKSPSERWAIERDSLTVNEQRYTATQNVPLGQRQYTAADWDPSQWVNTAPTGPTSLGRVALPTGVVGSQLNQPQPQK